MTDEEINNAKPIAQLLEAHHQLNEAIEAVIERDVKAGLYKLVAGPRKEQVKLLAAQGMTNRQIAKQLGVSHPTVASDLAEESGKNLPLTGKNLPPKSKKQKEEDRIEELRRDLESAFEAEKVTLQNRIDLLEDVLKSQKETGTKAAERYKKEIEVLQETINKGPPPTDFAKELSPLLERLVRFIQLDDLTDMLVELESKKEEITDELDMSELEKVIHALLSVSKRAKSWSDRLTPTNNRWENRVYSPHGSPTTLDGDIQ